jgi:hypothetical protein
MSESESPPRSDAIVYFVVSPLEGPGYWTCEDAELQPIGGVHALERLLERQSYWFVHLGQIGTTMGSLFKTLTSHNFLNPQSKRGKPDGLTPLSENQKLRSERSGKYSKRFSACWIRKRRTQTP